MATFANFIQTLNSSGKEFEHFVKWFLKNDPEWSTQVDQVWLWDEYPGRWGPDCGIDLVFKHKNGDLWAVQAKNYASNYYIKKSDVDSFISESNRPSIDHRLLICSTDLMGPHAKRVCDDQPQPVVRYMLWDFEQAGIEYPSSFYDLFNAKRKKPPEPRDYQQTAICDVVEAFKSADRGQLIMACGTGKTFTSLWIKERLNAKNVLVLLPSLSLLSQTLREWTFAANTAFDVLCVCSDQTVGKRGTDEAISSVSDVAFPVTSDVQDIETFLQGNGDRVIFSTYQSSPLISEAQRNESLPDFDIVFADEAHRCASKSDGQFSTVLDQNLIRAKKRLFMTATPRTYTTRVKKSAEGRGIEMVGMDDEKVFGKVMHSLSFGEAISHTPPLLTDYRVVIIGVDDSMISEWIDRRELVETGSGLTTDAESLAAQIGFLKAIKDYDITRAISFHSRVNRAKAFSEDIQLAIQDLNEEHRPQGKIWADYVHGKMPTGKRRQKLDRLKALGEERIGLLANARCLSEGVDVPALDGVAFIDPRRSQVDIIQAVGRAIRLSSNKTAGTIVLPVFIENSEDAEQSIESSRFKPIWDVLNALKAHDDILAGQLDQIRKNLGRYSGSGVNQADLSKIVIDLPLSVNEAFAESLRTLLVEKTTNSWEFWFGLLESFVEQEGYARVAASYKTADGYALGTWISNQRSKKDNLTPERRARLESLPGWVWDVYEAQWENAFAELLKFVEQEGHARVAAGYKTVDGFGLGWWVSDQRKDKHQLTVERRARLESLQGWVWDAPEAQWEEGFEALLKFIEKEGHSMVMARYKTEDGFRLGWWASKQRKNKDQLTDERRARLESLPGWVWDVFEAQWENGFAELLKFVEQEGHARVAAGYKTVDGFGLGQWMRTQRKTKEKLSPEHQQQLESLPGWVWDVFEAQWGNGFAELLKFVEEKGNARVPRGYKTEDGFALDSWTGTQRKNKDQLTDERRARLESLPGWVWDVYEAQWENAFAELLKFVEQEGHAIVPGNDKTEVGIGLGSWVINQRKNKDQLTDERRARLESLPGWVWDALEASWDNAFTALQKFVENEGNARVPSGYKTEDGIGLGRWISYQRKNKDQLTDERRARLESMPGWVWDTLEARWEEGFEALLKFVEKEEHSMVPYQYKNVDGFALGTWVRYQRISKDSLTSERRQRLESLPGWVWKVRS